MAIEVYGNWDKGYALDLHTVSSTPIIDETGAIIDYENHYTTLGKAMYLFKYRNDYSALSTIMAAVTPFLDKWKDMNQVEYVMPVPPTKKYRLYQPAEEIARQISQYLNIGFANGLLINRSDIEAKHQNRPANSIAIEKKLKYKHSFLLVDDLFNTGNTLNECVNAMKQNDIADQIFVLTITKTRAGGLR